MFKKAIYICFGLFASSIAFGQELNLNSMTNIWQSNRTNPGYIPQSNLIIGLPSIYNNLNITNITYNDLIGEDENGERTIQINNVLNQLEGENKIREQLALETISLGFNFEDTYFSLHHTLHFNAYLNFPQTLPQLIWEGNAQFIGETVSFGHDINVFAYQEIGIGIARKLGDFISIGARIKSLNGLGDITTERTKLSLYTDPDIYQLEVDADYKINTSTLLEYNSLDSINFSNPFNDFKLGDFFTKNRGFAVDFGVDLAFDKWKIGVSVVDLGKINWKEDVRNYEAKSSYEYAGLDVARDYFEGELSFDSATDTLQEIFQVRETAKTYSTKLPAKFYGNVRYEFNEKLDLGAVVYIESYRDDVLPAFGINAQYQVLDIWSVGGSFSHYNESNLIGLNTVVELGSVQAFVITNTVLGAIQRSKSHNSDIRLGLNLLLNRED